MMLIKHMNWTLVVIGKLLVFLLLISAPSAIVITTETETASAAGGGLRQLIRCHPCPVKSGDPRCSHTHNAGRYISICRRPRPAQHSASEGGVQRTVLSAPNYSATTIIPPPPSLSLTHSLHRVIDYSSSRRSPSVCPSVWWFRNAALFHCCAVHIVLIRRAIIIEAQQ